MVPGGHGENQGNTSERLCLSDHCAVHTPEADTEQRRQHPSFGLKRDLTWGGLSTGPAPSTQAAAAGLSPCGPM